ncbi:hypothetical protein TPHA_0D01720 [Tetrapisispora phaffii CBS 4417]|uniref:Inositol-1-monophosphatase n=1 Tax=Tetrapisispora phaffii (strain ATCC 24235 / CBS 4417 / NBRC 1672 / NRRL Y-8282 / UCD 70-5) TaxID=1071381 RepID=G8BSJ1_TETPH|nr:hypothetical protein TPHA_0D01720 [Tetrapisispora phaffii CBS 4417]CCE62812.1 hypothetical protein TPHA_0D01720 [Tetrapisispora phaffii CBS 4417]
MVLSSNELKDIENKIIDLLNNEIGPIIKKRTGTTFGEYSDKTNSTDIVTEVDKSVEKKIKEFISENYPNFSFIGEETYIKGETKIGPEPTFIVDPIDGTTNFVHAFPFSCTSIGLSENGDSVLGVVYNPHIDQMFHGSKGNGSYLNGERLDVKKRPLDFTSSLVALESGYERGDTGNFLIKSKLCKAMLSENGAHVHGVRSLGSAAMNICYAAAGYLDCYWEGGPWCWDVCASKCILEEAGGILVGGNKGVWDIHLNERVYLAVRGGTTEAEQKKYVEKFWSYLEGDLVYEYSH